jgi:predicted Rossmann fold flavoprotein
MDAVAVVGGGPAGLMAAVAAAGAGAGVTVFDAAAPGATILRTGGGRCNLANALSDPRELAACFPRGGKFLLSVFSRFGSPETLDWFRSRGLRLTVEDEGRVFPASGRAADVRALLLSEARRLGARMRGGTGVSGLERSGGGFHVLTAGGKGSRAAPGCWQRVIVATGGSWKNPGGSGYRLAAGLGHTVTPLAPSLSALTAAERWLPDIAGVTIPQARATAQFEGRRAADEEGGLLFTHRGISGPLAFRISSRCAFLPIDRERPLRVTLRPVPGLFPGAAEAGLEQAAAAHPRQAVLTALGRWVPRSLGVALLGLAGVDPAAPCGQLSRRGRQAVAGLLCGLPITVTGREQGSEMVTAGGVQLDEVTPATMQSRLVPGLFFAGEILDVDGFTGGFNLQAAWSTGRLAGLAAGRPSAPGAGGP